MRILALVVVSFLAVAIAATPVTVGSARENCLARERSMRNSAENPGSGVGPPSTGGSAGAEPRGQQLTDFVDDNCMRLNYVQVIGTHNSYHLQPRPEILQLIASFDPALAWTVDYSHLPLGSQFEQLGMRQVELDVFADPAGGLFAFPLGALIPFPDPAVPLPVPGLLAPGLKVQHIPDIDFKSNCLTFISCLTAIKAWSDANPDHLPVLILVEAKDEVLPPALEQLVEAFLGTQLVDPVPFGPDALNTIDAEILSVFPRDQLITPDDVRGSRSTLEQAVLKDGWPALNQARGRVMFALDNEDSKRTDYVAGHPSLAGRVMFTNSVPGTPEAAFVEVDDPIAGGADIQELVNLGYLVRTRADDNTIEARFNLTARRDAAIASGAHFISTDYPQPDPDFPGGYFVAFPGGATFRCNPVLSPPDCDEASLEAIALGLTSAP